ncbi:hypothetical protein ETR_15796 [Erwinia tracheiphila PSU-1]|nr:hypothetical protein ETR_15796 [Erwinia tracheiphila PSU-1]
MFRIDRIKKIIVGPVALIKISCPVKSQAGSSGQVVAGFSPAGRPGLIFLLAGHVTARRVHRLPDVRAVLPRLQTAHSYCHGMTSRDCS